MVPLILWIQFGSLLGIILGVVEIVNLQIGIGQCIADAGIIGEFYVGALQQINRFLVFLVFKGSQPINISGTGFNLLILGNLLLLGHAGRYR